MLRLLFVTTLPPYPDFSGGRQRTFNFIMELSMSFSITVLYPGGDNALECSKFLEEKGIKVIEGLKPQKNFLTYSDGYFGSYPILFSPFVESVEGDYFRIEKEFEIIYIDHLHMSPLILKTKDRMNLTKILDEHNVESYLMEDYVNELDGFKKIAGKKYVKYLKKYEKKIIQEFNFIVAASENDKTNLIKWGGDPSKIKMIKNGAYAPEVIPQLPRDEAILYVGALDWKPNIDAVLNFLENIFKPLSQKFYNLNFIVAGSNPHQELINKIDEMENVDLIADFKNLNEVYSLSSICIAPGFVTGGTKIKAVEALLHGRPVVCSAESAEGVENLPGVHIYENDEEFLEILENMIIRREEYKINRFEITDLSWTNSRKNFRKKIIECLL